MTIRPFRLINSANRNAKLSRFQAAPKFPDVTTHTLFIFVALVSMLLLAMPACAAGSKRLSASPTSLSFPSQTVGTTSSSQSVTLTNTSGRTVTLQSVSVSNSAFVISGWNGQTTLSPSGTLQLRVAFNPSAEGSTSGTLTVTATAAANASIALSGVGASSQPAPTVSISISPTSASLQVGTTAQFSAAVSGTTNTAVTWKVNGVTGGSSTVGTISSGGVYTAPASVPSGGSVSVSAQSVADTTKSASATVLISSAPTAVSVSISPTSASVQGGQTKQFSATVSGTTNTSVNWFVNGTQGGSATYGTISSSGLYTAPACPSSSNVTVAAVSAYDSSASANSSVSLSSASATSGDYYVASNGSDSNDGSACHPWASIQKAASSATAGAKVHVGPGTYYITSAIKTSNSGTSSQPISFISESRWGAKIVANAAIDSCWLNSGSYVTIEGFDITESSGGSCRIGLLNYASNVRLLSNRVHDLTRASAIVNCDGNAGAAGIDTYSSTASNVDIIGNIVGHIGNASNHSGVYIQGIYTAMQNVRVRNNIVYQAMSFGINMGAYSSSNSIANNTVFANGYGGIWVGGSATSATVTHNIVYNNNNTGIDGSYAPSSNQYLNNLVTGQSTNWNLASGASHSGGVTSSPQFVYYMPDGTGDYHLSSGSPAVNAGTSQSAPANDFDDGPRPMGGAYDIGAYEYGAPAAAWPW